MASLVLAEHNNSTLSEATARAVTAARHLGEPVHVLIAGSGCGGAADEAVLLQGVDTVVVADDPRYAHMLAEPVAMLILSLASGYASVLAPATANGKNILPRVAALLDVPQISDVTRILSPDHFERPAYAGSVIETVAAPDGKKVLTVRVSAFAPAPSGGAALMVSIPPAADPGLSEFLDETPALSGRPELSSAKIVVAGGRGLHTAENFHHLERIADKLGAAVGASRAAVDAGFAANACQIGQTGQSVAPDLYLALGISGAIQHLAGIKDAKVIVAINKDEEAPIFGIADYGLVADLFQALPELELALGK
ncbi:electron transfer flavoprotein alpha subunit [Rhizomicrobium palustre]|uniref:Electron transfer flavoprotein subunit alpha n=1 Tax=Rhizomicrobium palustre TaxID=189966 RepID=A0A846MWI6_9PROT|nr:FAD-binding protein [Rhizomicrobium palustre]NIK87918.1 electron transfer flavoprotein alpha subunit [Rhizomicrobium palustre]